MGYLRRAFAIGAVAVVALGGEDRLADLVDLIAGDEAERVGEAREGLLVAVAHAEAAADGDVVAEEFSVLDDRDVAEVLRVDVHVVRGRHGEAGLEFARQIGRSIHGLDLGLAAGDQLFVEPDLVVGAGLREGVVGPVFRVLINLLQHRRLLGVDGRHDVAVHVAAGRDRVEQHLVHPLDQGLHVALQHAMELEGLARGDAQRGQREIGRELIEDEPLLRGRLATRKAHAKHERVGLVLARLLQRHALVAIILDVGAVELDQLLRVGGDVRRGEVGELRLQVAAQVTRGGLDTLVGDEGLGSGGGIGGHDGRKEKG